MADQKISQLTTGDPAQSGDLLPIARSGANFKVTASSVANLALQRTTTITASGTGLHVISAQDLTDFDIFKLDPDGNVDVVFQFDPTVDRPPYRVDNIDPTGDLPIGVTWAPGTTAAYLIPPIVSYTFVNDPDFDAINIAGSEFLWNVNGQPFIPAAANLVIFTTTPGAGVTLEDHGGGELRFDTSGEIPKVLGFLDRTGLTAAFSNPLAGVVVDSFARISVYLKITTAGSVSSTIGPVTVTYVDATDNSSQTVTLAMQTSAGAMATSSTGNATTTILSGSLFVKAKAATDISLDVAYAANAANSMTYALRATCELLTGHE